MLLNDIFNKIFEINMDKRASVSYLKDHGVLKSKVSEEEAT